MEVWQDMGRNSSSQLAPTKSLPASEGTAPTRAGFLNSLPAGFER